MHDVHRCRTGNCTGNGVVDIGADAITVGFTRILEIEQEKGSDVGIDDIFPLVAGAVNMEMMQDGAMDAGA